MYNYISFKFNFSSKMWARCSPEERGRTSMPCCNAVLDFFCVDTIIIHDFCCNAALMGGNLQSFFLQNYCFTVLFVSFWCESLQT